MDPDKASDNRTVQDFRKDCLRELKKIKPGLAGAELRDGQRGADSLSLQALHPSVRTASPRKLALRPLLPAQGSLPDGLCAKTAPEPTELLSQYTWAQLLILEIVP